MNPCGCKQKILKQTPHVPLPPPKVTRLCPNVYSHPAQIRLQLKNSARTSVCWLSNSNSVWNNNNNIHICDNSDKPENATANCPAWSRKEGSHFDSCSTNLSAICHLDQTRHLIFPDPEEYVRIIPEFDAIRFEKVENVAGWRLNFSIDIWPSNNLSRKYKLTER